MIYNAEQGRESAIEYITRALYSNPNHCIFGSAAEKGERAQRELSRAAVNLDDYPAEYGVEFLYTIKNYGNTHYLCDHDKRILDNVLKEAKRVYNAKFRKKLKI
jgi:hypothetical protein